jgi:guanylate kinase
MDKLEVKNLSFFLLPENLEVLKQRAEKRGGMTPQMIQDRIKLAVEEIEQSKDFDYQITNYEGKLQQTTDNIASIIKNHLANSRPVDKN